MNSEFNEKVHFLKTRGQCVIIFDCDPKNVNIYANKCDYSSIIFKSQKNYHILSDCQSYSNTNNEFRNHPKSILPFIVHMV